jgi:hypothetical protein
VEDGRYFDTKVVEDTLVSNARHEIDGDNLIGLASLGSLAGIPCFITLRIVDRPVDIALWAGGRHHLQFVTRGAINSGSSHEFLFHRVCFSQAQPS